MDVPELTHLQEVCAEGRIGADVLRADAVEHVSVDGHDRLLATVEDGGTGLWAVWTRTTWLVDVSACRAVGLRIDGGKASVAETASFTAAPSKAEAQLLLSRAGYVAADATKPEQAVGLWLASPPAPASTKKVRVDALTLTVTRSPALAWHAGAPPEAPVSPWTKVPAREDATCPCFAVEDVSRMTESVADVGRWRVHTWTHAIVEPRQQVVVVEDVANRRWAVGGAGLPGEAVGTGLEEGAAPPSPPPDALAGWTWWQRRALLDPGVTEIVAGDADQRAWTIQLRFDDDTWSDHVAWTADGLEVAPFDGAGDPVVVPTATLLQALRGDAR